MLPFWALLCYAIVLGRLFPAYLVRTFHLAPKDSSIGGVYTQVLADELRQPEGSLVVVHGALLLGPGKPAAAIVSVSQRQRQSHGDSSETSDVVVAEQVARVISWGYVLAEVRLRWRMVPGRRIIMADLRAPPFDAPK
jgi:hypothetical protein